MHVRVWLRAGVMLSEETRDVRFLRTGIIRCEEPTNMEAGNQRQVFYKNSVRSQPHDFKLCEACVVNTKQKLQENRDQNLS